MSAFEDSLKPEQVGPLTNDYFLKEISQPFELELILSFSKIGEPEALGDKKIDGGGGLRSVRG